ncbi:MAG: hypothetical protein HQM13_16785 [SAR324 cluster bacterium]|nr:hypothetical protein [SAR324 cluster bacterium]
MEKDPVESPPETNSKSPQEEMEDLTYFHVSLTKLVVMGILTAGIYELYWHYRNWSHLRFRDRRNIKPVWRAVFSLIFAYSLFSQIKSDAISKRLEVDWSALLLFTLYLILGLFSFAPLPFGAISLLGVLPTVLAQKTINQILESEKKYTPNTEFSQFNILWIGFGLFIMSIGFLGVQ